MNLPQAYINNMKEILKEEYDLFYKSYSSLPVRGLRINTLKISVEDFLKITPCKLTPTGISKEGFIIEGEAEKIGLHPYHIGGAFYIQEPSAMSVVSEIERLGIFDKPIKALDLCAAPGGKSTAIGEMLKENSVLVANEIISKRAIELSRNIERIGITNSVVTNLKPQALAELLPNYFDLVLVDAPCSGEGMFRKNPEAINEWSIEHTKTCMVRQREILNSAKNCVVKNGYLVYSTCTFNKFENEGVVEEFVKSNKEFEVVSQKRLFPHTHRGEGHFVCVMRKGESETHKLKSINYYKPCKDNNFYALMHEIFDDFNANAYVSGTNYILASDEVIEVANIVPSIYAGVLAGIQKQNRAEPYHSLFMAAHGFKFKNCLDFSADSKEIKSYLAGNTLETTAKGKYYLISCDSFPLGYAKQSDGILKNKLPKGLRVHLTEVRV